MKECEYDLDKNAIERECVCVREREREREKALNVLDISSKISNP